MTRCVAWLALPVCTALMAFEVAAGEPDSVPATPAPPATTPASLSALAAPSADSVTKVIRLSVVDCLRRGAKTPRVTAAEHGVAVSRARSKEARLARLPHIEVRSLLAPLPKRAGDAICDTPSPDCTPDSSLFGSTIDRYGILSATDITATLPLFTWGKLDAARDIADALVRVAEGEVERTRSAVYKDVARAYYGSLLLSDLIDVIEEGRDRLAAARKKVDEGLAKGSVDYSPIDRHKLDAFAAELEGRYYQAVAARATALTALTMLVGSAPRDRVEPLEEYLEPIRIDVVPLAEYIARAEASRPELTMLEAGLEARKRAIALERGGLLPDVGVLAYFGYHYSNVAEDQISPFAYDPYNHLRAGVGLGVRWSLDFGPKLARLSRARAELRKLDAEGEAIRGAIRLEVISAHADVTSALERVRATERGLKSARKWARAAAASFGIGTGKARELLDALLAEGQLAASNLQAIQELNLAIVVLANATGEDAAEVMDALLGS